MPLTAARRGVTDPKMPPGKPAQARTVGLPNGVPLFLLALALLVGAYLSWTGVLVRDIGRVPVWSLLMLTGFMAAIGGTIAFLFAEEDRSPEEEVKSYTSAQGGEMVHAANKEVGRPRPEVRRRQPSEEPWRETWPDEDRPGPLSSVPPVGSTPRARRLSSLANFDEVSAELDSIERDLTPRRRRAKSSSR